MSLIALDFETEGIAPRPDYPPKPVGLAVWVDKYPKGAYYSWGHPTGNGTTQQAVATYISKLFANPDNEFVFHNAPFDIAVFEEQMDILVPWKRCHDTMLMAFLKDPYGELSLKPLAEKYLGEPPDEQDAVKAWLCRHGIVRSNQKDWGAFISKAPAQLVAPYAIGDVRKTLGLYHLFKGVMK